MITKQRSDVHVARLEELATFFEAGAPHFDFHIRHGFQFSEPDLEKALNNRCRTSGCIAAFVFPDAVKAWQRETGGSVAEMRLRMESVGMESDMYEADWRDVAAMSGDYLGLSPFERQELFEGYRDHNLPYVTPRMAGQAIRNLMAGNLPWDGVRPEPVSA